MIDKIKQFLYSGRFNRLFKEGFWVILGQGAAILGLLVGVRVTTSFMPPSVYGKVVFGMTLAGVVHMVLWAPLTNAATRFYASAVEKKDFAGYIRALKKLFMSAAGFMLLVSGLLFLVNLIFFFNNEWLLLSTVAFIFSIFRGGLDVFNGINGAARHRGVVAWHQGVDPWLRLLLAVVFIIAFGAKGYVVILGYVVANILVLISQCIFFQKIFVRQKHSIKIDPRWRKEILKYSWPLSSFGIFTCMQLFSDKWALMTFSTMRELGLYGALFQVGYYPMTVCVLMFIQFLAPIFYARAGDASDVARNRQVKKMTLKVLFITSGAMLGFFLLAFFFHEKIFQMFVAKEYISVSYLLPWVVLSGGFVAAEQFLSLNLFSQLKTKIMIAPKVFVSLLGVALNFTGAYFYGISGVIGAKIIFSFSDFFIMFLLSKNEDRKIKMLRV